MRHCLALVPFILSGCAASSAVQSSRATAAAGVLAAPSASVRLDRVALTTAVDSITMGPATPDRRQYPNTVERLFLCFRTNGARAGDNLHVAWHREGVDRPIHNTTASLEGDGRSVAEYEAVDPFRPGRHFVRIRIGGEHVADIPFVIDGDPSGAIRPPTVARLRVFAPDGSEPDRSNDTPRFADGTAALRAAFAATDLTPAHDVTVHWRLGSRELTQTAFDGLDGTNELTANLSSDAPLPAGEYEVQVRLDGSAVATANFAIGDSASAVQTTRRRGPTGPARVSQMLVTAEACPRSAPGVPAAPTLRGDEGVLYLCVSYENLASGTPLEVQWYQNDYPEEPMAVTSFRPSGTGTLSASFMPNDRLPPGAYHVAVAVGADRLGQADFTIAP